METKNKINTLLIFIILISFITIFVLHEEIISSNSERNDLNKKNLQLNSRIDTLLFKKDSINRVNKNILDSNKKLEKENKDIHKRIKIKESELYLVHNRYNNIRNDSIIKLVEQRLNPTKEISDTLIVTRKIIENSLEIQDSLLLYKDINIEKNKIINKDIAIIANDSIIINNQNKQILLLENVIVDKDQIINNKNKELHIADHQTKVKVIKAAIKGTILGAIVTTALILL
jgi:hypothetical protein